MRLWSITVMLKTPQSGCRLLFKEIAPATGAAEQLVQPPAQHLASNRVTVTDDFGNIYTVDLEDIA